MASGRTSLFVFAVFAQALCAPRALAAPPLDPVHVVYEADEGAVGCPEASQFVTSVRERLIRGRLVDPAAQAEPEGERVVGSARAYRVKVRSVGTRFIARLDFEDPGGTARTREVAAASCVDASLAMALVTALAIDAGGVAPDDASSEGTLSASETLGLVETNVAPPPQPALVTPDQTESVSPSPRFPGGPSPPPEIELGLRATLGTPKAPDVLPGAELFVGLRDPDAMWLLELGLAGERGWRTSSGPGEVRFSFIGARLHGCGFSLALGSGWELWPCAFIETGALVAEGFIANPETQVDAWLAAGLAGRLNYRAGSESLHAEAGPLLPITRNNYVFGPTGEPAAVAHEVRVLGAFVALGGTLRIF